MLTRRWAVACVGLLAPVVGGLLACTERSMPLDTAGPTAASLGTTRGPSSLPEEEIFGDVTTTDSTDWWAYLMPPSNLPNGAIDSEYVAFGEHHTESDWGWFEVGGTGGGCESGVGTGDEAHALPGGIPVTVETHCVDVGTWFRLDLKQGGILQFRRPVDWVNWRRVLVDDDYIYIDSHYGPGDGTFVDVVASFDADDTTTISPALEITATAAPFSASWDPLEVHADGKYHIPGNFYVRVSASRTTESSPTYNQKAVLVRFFWEYGDNTTGTRFFSLPNDTGQVLARTHTYGSRDSVYNRTLFAHFAMPHDLPSPIGDTMSTDYGDSLKLYLQIHPAFNATISHSDTVMIGDTVHFADFGHDGGALLGRLWTFGDGDSDTIATPAHAYAAAGTKTVILTKTYAYHGLQVPDTATVVVLPTLDAGVIVGSYDGWPTNNEIEEHGDCMWEVTPTGGTGSYTYVWQKKWKPWWSTIPGETTQELYIADVGSSDFELRTIISSGPLADTTDVLSMTVAFRGQVCIIRK
jgi:hypothetical protein